MEAAVLTLPRGAFYIMLTALSVGPREHIPRASPVSMCATHCYDFSIFTNLFFIYTKPHSSLNENYAANIVTRPPCFYWWSVLFICVTMISI